MARTFGCLLYDDEYSACWQDEMLPSSHVQYIWALPASVPLQPANAPLLCVAIQSPLYTSTDYPAGTWTNQRALYNPPVLWLVGTGRLLSCYWSESQQTFHFIVEAPLWPPQSHRSSGSTPSWRSGTSSSSSPPGSTQLNIVKMWSLPYFNCLTSTKYMHFRISVCHTWVGLWFGD